MILSLTRLRLARWRVLPKFLKVSGQCIRQAASDGNCLGGATFLGPGLVFWTATLWRDEAALRAYVGSGAHREAMPFPAKWCSEAATAHFPHDRIPKREELVALLEPRARFTPLKEPTPKHRNQQLSPRSPWLRSDIRS